MPIEMITNKDELAAFCARCKSYPYVTVDTEFLRERTYYSQLCLVQVAYPGTGSDSAVLIDPLSDDMDLEPLYELFRNKDVVKVFHAARQDLEIFFAQTGEIPVPFFDTQVAAMVCGYGDQVGYETLVRKIARKSIDKSSRFTDWSRRPLSEKQQVYALADVTHLRDVYETLRDELESRDRASWVEEELAVLTSPDTYLVDPEKVWARIKTRNSSGKHLAIVQELAKFREISAQTRNVPRNRIIKDDAILELASLRPKSHDDLNKSRLLLRDARRGDLAAGILAAVKTAMESPSHDRPSAPPAAARRSVAQGLGELLRVLLKAKSEDAEVAQKLIANAAHLDILASEDDPDVPCMTGWRYEVFGRDAMRLKRGEIALSAKGDSVVLVEISAD